MLNRLSKREKILFGLVMATGLVALFLQFALYPLLNEYRNTKNEIEQIGKQVREAQKLAGTKGKEEEKLHLAQEKWQRAMDKFNTNMQDGLFLVQFSRELQKERVRIDLFKPHDIIDRKVILMLPVELELIGYYPQVVNILDFLENQANMTEIGYLEMGGRTLDLGGDKQMSLPDGMVKARCFLLIYSQPTPQGKLALDDIKNWRFGKTNPFLGKVPFIFQWWPWQPSNRDPVQPPARQNDNSNNYVWLQQPDQDDRSWLPPVAVN